MRKLILSMSTTVDGYVVGANGDMSWMKPDDDIIWSDLFNLLEDVDLFVLGSGMWEEYREYWKKALKEPGFNDNEVKYARIAERTEHIVFSKTINDSEWENTAVNNGDLATEIRKIKELPGKNIQIVGGAEFAAAMIDTGLVDEYRMLIHPALIAGGKSFWHQIKNRHRIDFVSADRLSNGVIVLLYKELGREK